MRDYGDIVGGRHSGDFEQFCKTADPHNVGLENVEVTTFDQFAETVAGVFVLVCLLATI